MFFLSPLKYFVRERLSAFKYIADNGSRLNDFNNHVGKRMQAPLEEKEKVVEAFRQKEAEKSRAQKAADHAAKVAAEAEASMEGAKKEAEEKTKAAHDAKAALDHVSGEAK